MMARGKGTDTDSPAVPVFWPQDVHNGSYCYGWVGPSNICVAGTLDVDTRDAAEAILVRVSKDAVWRKLKKLHIEPPSILGQCSFPAAQPALSRLLARNPTIELSLFGDISSSQSFVYYRRPDRRAMRFYSLDTHELDILPSQIPISGTPETRKHNMILSHDFTRPAHPISPSIDAVLLNQLNFARSISGIVTQAATNIDEHSSEGTSIDDPSIQPVTPDAPSGAITRHKSLLSLRPPSLLREMSTTIEQIDIRLEQLSFVYSKTPSTWRRSKFRSPNSISRYVKFYNCIWLVLNDVIIGIAFGAFLCENHRVLARMLDYLMQEYLINGMQKTLLWLNSWPAGLKLNTELSQFYCHTLLSVILLWARLLQSVAPYFPAVIWSVGAMGSFGMTMIIALLSDILSLSTAHLHSCYLLSMIAFSHMLGLAGSLWNLFRGKRFNVLRNRLDSWDYDIDQLLLGTILFTLIAFLFPTVVTYYALFAMTHLAIISVHAVLDTAIALLNHFPLFALMLRVKDPMRLPGRIVFQRALEGGGSLTLQNQPAPLSSIFTHYAHLWVRLSRHYHPLRLLSLLAAGRRLSPISRAYIRFSMVPVENEKEKRLASDV